MWCPFGTDSNEKRAALLSIIRPRCARPPSSKRRLLVRSYKEAPCLPPGGRCPAGAEEGCGGRRFARQISACPKAPLQSRIRSTASPKGSLSGAQSRRSACLPCEREVAERSEVGGIPVTPTPLLQNPPASKAGPPPFDKGGFWVRSRGGVPASLVKGRWPSAARSEGFRSRRRRCYRIPPPAKLALPPLTRGAFGCAVAAECLPPL